MSLSLIIQNNYHTTQIGLGNNGTILARREETNQRSSQHLIPLIEQLLQEHQLQLDDLDCIIANQGPGPFTSLRVVIATINGLSFGRKLPLVGIDGLVSLVNEHRAHTAPITLGLLNAYNNDAYFAFAAPDAEPTPDWHNIEKVLDALVARYPDQHIYCVGGGVELFYETVIAKLGSSAIIPDPLPTFCSLNYLYTVGHAQWIAHGGAAQIMPLYVKTQQFATTKITS